MASQPAGAGQVPGQSRLGVGERAWGTTHAHIKVIKRGGTASRPTPERAGALAPFLIPPQPWYPQLCSQCLCLSWVW